MTLITSGMGVLLEGVSQKPLTGRKDGQTTRQVNTIPDKVDGLITRYGTNHVAKLLSELSPEDKVSFYSRGDEERYFIIIKATTGDISIFGIDGVEHTVVITDPTDYIEMSNPHDDLAVVSVLDTTYLVNRKENVLSSTSRLEPALPQRALVHMAFATYGRTYKIFIDTVEVASWTAPDGDTVTDIQLVDTTYVATQLYNALVSSGPTGFTFTRDGPVIIIDKTGADFEIYTEDGAKGRDLVAIYKSVKVIGELPIKAPNNFKVEIKGSGISTIDDYWLQAKEKSGDSVEWTESLAPGISLGFDISTMPHTLIRTSIDGFGVATFEYTEGAWKDRDVGDDVKNPFPSFTDADNPLPIKNALLVQNRLCFLAGEAIISTRTSQFYNFWRTSTLTVLASDPFDTFSDSNQLNFLTDSAILDGDLICFSKDGQFSLPGGALTIASSLTKVGSYSMQEGVAPVESGNNVFFPFNYGSHTGVYSMTTGEALDKKVVRSATEEVTAYMPGTCRQLISSTSKDWLLVSTTDDLSKLFVFNWKVSDGEDGVRVLDQSAWHEWSFNGGEVMHGAIEGENLYLLINRENEVFLEYINLAGDKDEDLGISTRLDRKVSAVVTKDSHPIPKSTWADSYPNQDISEMYFIRGKDCKPFDIGLDFPAERDSGYKTAHDIADSTGATVIMGTRIYSSVEPSLPTVRDKRGNVIQIDKLLVSSMFISFEKLNDSSVTVTTRADVVTQQWQNSRVMSDVGNIIGFPEILRGDLNFAVMDRPENVTVRLDSYDYFPFQLTSVEWKGKFNSRGVRV